MFRIEDSTAFYFLILIPILVIVWYWSDKKGKSIISSFAKPDLFIRLVSGKWDEGRRFILILSACILFVFAAVNPQYGYKKQKAKVERSDIFFAVDISNSMNATDISPSRLEKAKRFVSKMIQKREGDQLGLILFAGGAYLQMPLTVDYAAADLFVKSANTDMAGTQGTAIGEAIGLAMRSTKEQHQRALIIVSDGEDHDEDAINMAEKASSAGWTVFTVGVGTETGGFVPVFNAGREEFKMDDEGNPVKSMLNVSLMKDIASAGKGNFYILGENENEAIRDINTQIDQFQKRAVEVNSFTEYRSYFQYFLFAGILLIVAEFFFFSKATNIQ